MPAQSSSPICGSLVLLAEAALKTLEALQPLENEPKLLMVPQDEDDYEAALKEADTDADPEE